MNLRSSHQQRLTEVLGARTGLGDEYKRLEALVTVSEVLICSCQVTAQWDKCWIPNLWFSLLQFHAVLYYSLFFSGKHHRSLCLWSKHYMKLMSVLYLKKNKTFFWWNHFVTLQRCVFYSLFCTCSLHYMMFISFCFFFCIQCQLFHSCSLFRNEQNSQQTCQEGMLFFFTFLGHGNNLKM